MRASPFFTSIIVSIGIFIKSCKIMFDAVCEKGRS